MHILLINDKLHHEYLNHLQQNHPRDKTRLMAVSYSGPDDNVWQKLSRFVVEDEYLLLIQYKLVFDVWPAFVHQTFFLIESDQSQ
ncbi:Uncharacterised protein [Acinetobacter baumannii]|nr:Uncharacterised protein [Acinetobacter baumannii]